MRLTQETERVAKRIGELYSVFKGTDAHVKITKKINDILIFGENVSIPDLSEAWDYYAYKKGIPNSPKLVK